MQNWWKFSLVISKPKIGFKKQNGARQYRFKLLWGGHSTGWRKIQRLKYFIFRQEKIKIKKLSIQGKKIKKDAQEK